MAKKCMVARDVVRKQTVEKYAARRKALKQTIKSPRSDDEEKARAVLALQKLPRARPVMKQRLRMRLSLIHI